MKFRQFNDEGIGFVYRWTNKLDGKMYVGSHNGNKKNYTGSGILFKRAVKKHGLENFAREILYVGLNFRQEEEQFLISVDAANSPLYYNLKNEALGGAFKGEKNGMYGRKLSVETRHKQGSAFRGKKRPDHAKLMMNEGNPMFGKSQHAHGIVNIAKSKKGKTYVEIFGSEKAKQLSKKLSDSQKGLSHHQNTFVCPCCHLQGKGPNMMRYHFKNCDHEMVDRRIERVNVRQQRKQVRLERKKICKSLYENGLTIQQIATQLSCSTLIIRRQLKADSVILKNRQEIYCVGCHEKVNKTTLAKYHTKCFRQYSQNHR